MKHLLIKDLPGFLLKEETKIDKYKAIISSITGVAYIDGYSAFLIDEDDPLKYGFVIN